MTRKSGNQKRTTCPRRMIVNFFFITVFPNMHPSSGFPSTELTCHSPLNLATLYPLQPLESPPGLS